MKTPAMKHFAQSATALLLAGTLAACGGGDNKESGNGGNDGDAKGSHALSYDHKCSEVAEKSDPEEVFKAVGGDQLMVGGPDSDDTLKVGCFYEGLNEAKLKLRDEFFDSFPRVEGGHDVSANVLDSIEKLAAAVGAQGGGAAPLYETPADLLDYLSQDTGSWHGNNPSGAVVKFKAPGWNWSALVYDVYGSPTWIALNYVEGDKALVCEYTVEAGFETREDLSTNINPDTGEQSADSRWREYPKSIAALQSFAEGPLLDFCNAGLEVAKS